MYNTLPVDQLYVFQLLCLLHKAVYNKHELPQSFIAYIAYSANMPISAVPTRTSNRLHFMPIKLTYGHGIIRFKASLAWFVNTQFTCFWCDMANHVSNTCLHNNCTFLLPVYQLSVCLTFTAYGILEFEKFSGVIPSDPRIRGGKGRREGRAGRRGKTDRGGDWGKGQRSWFA
jgi:hypothetical protein